MKNNKPSFMKNKTIFLIAITATLVTLAGYTLAGHDSIAVHCVPSTAVDPSCGDAHAAIQAAIDDADPGEKVLVGAGTYTEQIVISKKLTLTGIGSPVIDAPGVLALETDGDGTSIVEITGAGTKPTMSGFTVQGPLGSMTTAIHVHAGADAKITGNTIVSTDALSGILEGHGITVGSSMADDDAPAKAKLEGNTLSGFHRAGIVVIGVGSSAEIKGNTVTGAGATGLTTQQGITIQDGAGGKVSENTVKDIAYTGAGVSGVGIFLWDAAKNIDVKDNTIEDVQTGVMVQATEKVKIKNNEITDLPGGAAATYGMWLLGRGATGLGCNGGDGATPGLGCATTSEIENNVLTGNGAGTGIFLGKTPDLPFTPAPTAAKIKNNDISGWTLGLVVGPTGSVDGKVAVA